MVTQNIVYPFGEQEVDVPQGSKIAVAAYGEGKATIDSAVPVIQGGVHGWAFLSSVQNREKVFGTFTEARKIRITAGADPVYYSVGTSPVAIKAYNRDGVRNFHYHREDFDYFVAGNYTITTTEAGSGSATEALGNEDGGVLVITNDNADDDADFFQEKGEAWLFESGKELTFEARFKVSDATQSDVVFGLQITDTTPLDVTDGVFFLKPDGAATVNFLVEKDNTATTTSAVATLVNDTYIRLGFHYDGASTIDILVNGGVVGSSVITNMPDDEALTVSFGIQNGEAAAKVMTVDYYEVGKQR